MLAIFVPTRYNVATPPPTTSHTPRTQDSIGNRKRAWIVVEGKAIRVAARDASEVGGDLPISSRPREHSTLASSLRCRFVLPLSRDKVVKNYFEKSTQPRILPAPHFCMQQLLLAPPPSSKQLPLSPRCCVQQRQLSPRSFGM